MSQDRFEVEKEQEAWWEQQDQDEKWIAEQQAITDERKRAMDEFLAAIVLDELGGDDAGT